MPKTKVRLFFPDIETGQISVGFSTVDVINHIAEIDGTEVEFITYWQQIASAIIARDLYYVNTDLNPFDDAEVQS
ncbi:MAG TPA: hypothetical protein VII92_11380 [Anaerolineae bacterium]